MIASIIRCVNITQSEKQTSNNRFKVGQRPFALFARMYVDINVHAWNGSRTFAEVSLLNLYSDSQAVHDKHDQAVLRKKYRKTHELDHKDFHYNLIIAYLILRADYKWSKPFTVSSGRRI